MKCGRELEERDGPGRPAMYCSPVCRRAAELEIRRMNGLIARLERKDQDLLLDPGEEWERSERTSLRRRIRKERDRLEERLRVLLSAGAEAQEVNR